MTVTASRLGSAPITIDWSHLSSGPRHTADADALSEAWKRLKSRFETGDVGFYDTPIQNDLSQAAESIALAQDFLKRGIFTDCLMLGIGGSSLGPISLLGALTEKNSTGIRFHFVENPDPLDWKNTVRKLNPDHTLVCAITKSGTTFETMAQLLLALEWLGKGRMKTHLVAITDPKKGDLKSFASKEGIPTLHIAPSIGGRFSIFSPVGIFPAALAGLSVEQFLLGAKQVRDYVERTPHEKNPLFILASEFLHSAPKHPVHVCMPYSTRLKQLGAWFVQIWGESLGKDGKGFTPIAAVGATDQHSILQLLRDGPNDKITLFVTVDRVEDEVKIPAFSFGTGGIENQHYPAFKILENHTLHELLTVEYQATSLVLTKQGRPHLTFQIEKLDERCLGGLFFAFSVLTAVTGTLWEVNPFDQPGVEEGKVYIREALSHNRIETPSKYDDDNSPVGRLRRDRTS
jgi:glucose-6-phosphate isomerase